MSILENEIHQQANVLQHLLDEETSSMRSLARHLYGQFQYVMIAARGSSDNAARYAQYLFGAYNHLPVALATPSLFSIYEQSPNLNGALVMGISQSGQSPDIVQVIEASC
jgi:glucosamine--fructose-6-phosphate aminotransferase (isomerizing)